MVAPCSSRRPHAEHVQQSPGRLPSRLVIAALVLLAASEAGAQVRQDSLPPRSWSFGVATGPTFFYGDEGNNVGLNLESTIARRLGSRRAWLRGELSSHLFGAQRLYPCSLSVQSVCFSTSQRSVVGFGLSLQQFVGKDGDGMGRSQAYFLLGVQSMVSARVAEKIVDCSPGAVCPAEPITHHITNTDVGATVGAGHAWNAGPRSFFIETRLLQPLTKQVGSFTAFRLLPFTIGMRF